MSELDTLVSPITPVETGVFSGAAPDAYAVLTPLADDFALYADDLPLMDVCDVRISLFTKGSYTSIKGRITKALLQARFIVTGRWYIGHEDDTGYHHYAIDVAKEYGTEE